MSEQAFMQTIGKALSDVRDRRNDRVMTPSEPKDCQARLDGYKNRSVPAQMALLDPLKKSAAALNINLSVVDTAHAASASILNLILEKSPEYGTAKQVAAWRHPLIDRLDLGKGLSGHDIPLVLPPKAPLSQDHRDIYQKSVTESFVGITAADYCVADTATLTMKHRADQPRSVSLLPVIHVGVVCLNQLVENLSELYFRLQWDPEETAQGMGNGMTFISGPSKTGDIELVMVHGAHGPRELHLYVITGETI